MAVGPPTCPAEGSGCDADEWEGEFFPEIPKIKYEVIISISVSASFDYHSKDMSCSSDTKL